LTQLIGEYHCLTPGCDFNTFSFPMMLQHRHGPHPSKGWKYVLLEKVRKLDVDLFKPVVECYVRDECSPKTLHQLRSVDVPTQDFLLKHPPLSSMVKGFRVL
jgi:hypothetical protein